MWAANASTLTWVFTVTAADVPAAPGAGDGTAQAAGSWPTTARATTAADSPAKVRRVMRGLRMPME